MFDILNLSFLNVLDIILVAILMYYVYRLLKGTVAINIVIGIALLFLIWRVTDALKMEMLSSILGYLLSGGVIALIIVFQQEIRRFLLMIGTTNFSANRGLGKQLKFLRSEIQTEADAKTIINTCATLGNTKTGALIVLERSQSLDFVKSSGDAMNVEVNSAILESIFFKNSPLHDGACIIKGNNIVATRVILPISQKTLPSRFGLRHRAAIGITEKTDAVCVIVSEETGKISYVKDGEFVLYNSNEDLIELLNKDLNS